MLSLSLSHFFSVTFMQSNCGAFPSKSSFTSVSERFMLFSGKNNIYNKRIEHIFIEKNLSIVILYKTSSENFGVTELELFFFYFISYVNDSVIIKNKAFNMRKLLRKRTRPACSCKSKYILRCYNRSCLSSL